MALMPAKEHSFCTCF